MGVRTLESGQTLPLVLNCPHCGFSGPTRVVLNMGIVFWVTFAVLLFFTACFALFLFCCCEYLKDADHYCTQCNRIIGKNRAS